MSAGRVPAEGARSVPTQARVCAKKEPPPCNTGGIKNLDDSFIWEDSEELVTDGEDVWLKCKTRQTTGLVFVDYCSFTLRGCDDPQALADSVLSVVADKLGKCEKSLGRGALYYESSLSIYQGGSLMCRAYFGGTYQRGSVHVQFPGSFWLGDDGTYPAFVKELADASGVDKLSRIDICRDVFDEKFTLADIRSAYADGLFKPSRGVMPSNHGYEDKWRGSTFNVGRRENGKVIRSYEKSMQLARKHGWVRVEMELRSEGRKVPTEALIKANQYFAGANAFCAGLADTAIQSRAVTFQSAAELTAEHLFKYASIAYGRFFGFLASSGWKGQAALQSIADNWDGELPRRMRISSPEALATALEHGMDRVCGPLPNLPWAREDLIAETIDLSRRSAPLRVPASFVAIKLKLDF